jgi:hypothetical protein
MSGRGLLCLKVPALLTFVLLSNMKNEISIEQWWNCTDRRKPEEL